MVIPEREDLRLQCLECGGEWRVVGKPYEEIQLGTGQTLQQSLWTEGYWKCPKGCNDPSSGGRTLEVETKPVPQETPTVDVKLKPVPL